MKLHRWSRCFIFTFSVLHNERQWKIDSNIFHPRLVRQKFTICVIGRAWKERKEHIPGFLQCHNCCCAVRVTLQLLPLPHHYLWGSQLPQRSLGITDREQCFSNCKSGATSGFQANFGGSWEVYQTIKRCKLPCPDCTRKLLAEMLICGISFSCAQIQM